MDENEEWDMHCLQALRFWGHLPHTVATLEEWYNGDEHEASMARFSIAILYAWVKYDLELAQ